MINQIKFILLFILLDKFKQEQTIIDRAYLESPALYKNEICSYNGNPKVKSNETIECSCYSSFVDEPREDYKKYVGKQIVHCSYKRKKRFTTFFLAGLVPMGFDYFYLEHYIYFLIVFISFILMVISYLVNFFMSYKLKEMYEGSKYKYSDKSDNNYRNNRGYKSNKKDEKEQLKKCVDIHGIINRIFSILFIIYWIVDIVLQARGLIKDRYGVETENDMNSLFSKEEI